MAARSYHRTDEYRMQKASKSDTVSATGAHQSASDVKACHKPTLKQAMKKSVLWSATGDQDFSQAGPEKKRIQCGLVSDV